MEGDEARKDLKKIDIFLATIDSPIEKLDQEDVTF